MAKLVSKTYGDALFSLAMEEQRLDEFFDAASNMIEALQQNGEFEKLMKHPQFTREQKAAIIEETFAGQLPKEMIGMLLLLVKKGHASDMIAVFRYFITLVKEEKKIGHAKVVSAISLSEDQKAKVERRLLETTRYESFEMDYSVDETLIGGLVIRIGDRVVDSSIKTKLYELTRNLREVQV